MKVYEKPALEVVVFDSLDKNMALVSGNYNANNFNYSTGVRNNLKF